MMSRYPSADEFPSCSTIGIPFMMTSSNGNIFRVTGPLCGEFTSEFPSKRAVTCSFDVFFYLRLNKRLSKQSWGWWFQTPSCSLWRHCNVLIWRENAILTTTYWNASLNENAWISIIIPLKFVSKGSNENNNWPLVQVSDNVNKDRRRNMPPFCRNELTCCVWVLSCIHNKQQEMCALWPSFQ